MRRREAASGAVVPPGRLLDPRVEDWLDSTEAARSRAETRATGWDSGLLLAMARVREARWAWVRDQNPGIGEREVARMVREVFAVPVPGRSDLAQRPALPRWSS